MHTVDPAHYRQVLGHFPTGVTIITAAGAGGPAGLAVGSFFSLSLDPPLVAFAATRTSTSWPSVRDAGAFCVNVLAADQEETCRVFAMSGTDKFAHIGWKPAGSGSPRIDDVLAWIDCDMEDIVEGGDHQICIGRVREMAVERETGPLVFYRGGYGTFSIDG